MSTSKVMEEPTTPSPEGDDDTHHSKEHYCTLLLLRQKLKGLSSSVVPMISSIFTVTSFAFLMSLNVLAIE